MSACRPCPALSDYYISLQWDLEHAIALATVSWPLIQKSVYGEARQCEALVRLLTDERGVDVNDAILALHYVRDMEDNR